MIDGTAIKPLAGYINVKYFELFIEFCRWTAKNCVALTKCLRTEKVKVKESSSVLSHYLWPHGIYSPWNSPGQNTEVGSFFLLQGCSQPRDWTQVSCIADRFFSSWATSSIQFSSVTQSCPTLYHLMDHSTPDTLSITNSWV